MKPHIKLLHDKRTQEKRRRAMFAAIRERSRVGRYHVDPNKARGVSIIDSRTGEQIAGLDMQDPWSALRQVSTERLEPDIDDTESYTDNWPPVDRMYRTHSWVAEGHRGKRLGTALYIMGLRRARQRGDFGLFSIPYERSPDAAKVWQHLRPDAKEVRYIRRRHQTPTTTERKQIAEGELSEEDFLTQPSSYTKIIDVLTSVRPHAVQRGRVLRIRRKRIQSHPLGADYFWLTPAQRRERRQRVAGQQRFNFGG